MEAPRGGTTDDGLGSTRQKAATFTKKHGRTYHGYKAPITTDGNGLITQGLRILIPENSRDAV